MHTRPEGRAVSRGGQFIILKPAVLEDKVQYNGLAYLLASQGRRKHHKLGGTKLQGHFSLRKMGHFLKIKRVLL